MTRGQSHVSADAPVITMTYQYDAPLSLVWDVFTKPEHLQHWWGPDGFDIEHISGDFRVGGHWQFVMVGPDGTRWDNYHLYSEIVPHKSFSHRHGARADDRDAPNVTIEFERDGDRTRVTMTMVFSSFNAREEVLAFGADKLGLQTLAKAQGFIDAYDLAAHE